MKQAKVSIIVPVYNVEKYLRQCLDSIVAQTLQDIEIIIINDGSTDGSLSIIKEYAAKDERIKVIDKANEGYGKTMNRGIDAATGKFIGIVESDDWIEPNMYEILYDLAASNNAEVAKCRYIVYRSRSGKERLSDMPKYDTGRIIDPKKNPRIFLTHASIWCAIYDANFLRSNDIRFLETPGASFQDIGFNFRTLAAAKRLYLTMQALLHYRTGHGSQSTRSKSKVFCVCDEFAEIDRWLKQRQPDLVQAFAKIFNTVKCNNYCWNVGRLDGESKEAFLELFRKDLAPIFPNKVETAHMSMAMRARINEYLNPTIWNKIKRVFFVKVLRLFLKDDINNGDMLYRLLYIPIWRRKIEVDSIVK